MTDSNQRDNSHLLLQFTDPHLCRSASARLRGVVTVDCLDAVIRLAEKSFPRPDTSIVTGDLSHDGSPNSYRMLAERLRFIGGVQRFLPGNHDQPEVLRSILDQPDWPTHDAVGDWRLIGLSTHLPGQEGGRLDRSQLEVLERELSSAGDRHTVIALHHPPLSTGSPWLDRIGLENYQALRRLLKGHRQVRAILFGHAHQEIDRLEHGIRWLGCPSTCVQFLPMSDKPYSDTRLPGYRWLRLHSDRTLETGVERLTAWPAGSTPAGLRET